MQVIKTQQTHNIVGGFKINLGHVVGAAVVGFITGGPVGLGYAIGGSLIAHGVNNLEELYHQKR